MTTNPDNIIDIAIPFGKLIVRAPNVDQYHLVSDEENKLALFNLLKTLASWPLTNISDSANQYELSSIDQSSWEQILKEVLIKYADMLFNEFSFSPYRGHFLVSAEKPDVLKNLYWGKCLDNAGVIMRLLATNSASQFPELNLNQLPVRRCEIEGLIPKLRHFAAYTRDSLGHILFWDFTALQYGDLLQPPLRSPVIWGVFSDELAMQESIKSFFRNHGKTVATQIYQ